MSSDNMIVAHMDDTILKKSGRNIPGAGWRRDPLRPPFQTNFIWGQRFLQISMALPEHPGCARSRAVPVDFYHCPTAKKPGKTANESKWKQYKEQQRILKRLTLIGRIRKDTKLYRPANQQPNRGRKRVYGDRLPTPEQSRKAENYPWVPVIAYLWR
jgi:hypothetical protein